jgi:hypothetical protein
MPRIAIAALALLLAGPAAAQSVVDGSDQGLARADVDGIVRAVTQWLDDPSGVQIRGIYRSSGTNAYCGEVALPGTAFVPFYANLDATTAYVLSVPPEDERYAELVARLKLFDCLG